MRRELLRRVPLRTSNEPCGSLYRSISVPFSVGPNFVSEQIGCCSRRLHASISVSPPRNEIATSTQDLT